MNKMKKEILCEKLLNLYYDIGELEDNLLAELNRIKFQKTKTPEDEANENSIADIMRTLLMGKKNFAIELESELKILLREVNWSRISVWNIG